MAVASAAMADGTYGKNSEGSSKPYRTTNSLRSFDASRSFGMTHPLGFRVNRQSESRITQYETDTVAISSSSTRQSDDGHCQLDTGTDFNHGDCESLCRHEVGVA